MEGKISLKEYRRLQALKNFGHRTQYLAEERRLGFRTKGRGLRRKVYPLRKAYSRRPVSLALPKKEVVEGQLFFRGIPFPVKRTRQEREARGRAELEVLRRRVEDARQRRMVALLEKIAAKKTEKMPFELRRAVLKAKTPEESKTAIDEIMAFAGEGATKKDLDDLRREIFGIEKIPPKPAARVGRDPFRDPFKDDEEE